MEMIIVAGQLRVDAAQRDRFLASAGDVMRAARAAPGCLDFTLAADPLDPARVNVYERWESEADLLRFRGAGPDPDDMVAVSDVQVRRYCISAVQAP